MVVRNKDSEATETTPENILYPEEIFSTKGRWMEQNVATCLIPLNEWLDVIGQNQSIITLVDIRLGYIYDFSQSF